MSPLLDAVLRSSAVLLIGLAAAAILGRKAAALRHFILAASVFAAAVVAPLSYAMPAWQVTIAPPPVLPQSTATPIEVTESASSAARADEQGSAPSRTSALITTVWLIGFALTAALMVFRIVRLVRTSARARPVRDGRWIEALRRTAAAYGIGRPVTALQTETPDLLATWGAWRPRVLLPIDAPAWSDDRIHVVLCHELAHIRRHDWLVQIAADAVRTIYWFNPLMWIACMWLRRESEHACDDVVMNAGVPAPDYAAHLLALARTSRRGLAIPMARRSTLERRIAAMLKTGLDRRALSRPALFVVTALLAAVVVPAAALRAGQSGPLPLSGTIYDPSGAVLPGVSVTLQDAQAFKQQATTDAAGRFEFPPVPAGKYVLDASLRGFKALHSEFTAKDARDWDRPMTMQVGELSETITVVTARVPRRPQTSPTPGAPAPVRVRVGGNIKAPQKLASANPVYPDTMRDAGLAGVVPLEAIIGVDGSVLSVRVLGAPIHPDFAKSALTAVRQWQFSPTLLNGVPVEVVMKVTVSFALE